ncbi:hypothetical protein ACGFX2_23115 [Streptomyces goshikiensis]|uniref:hypothetical protein n=1 Tax=Streptomyces goshikiensis TaxID=1942 RepID=UPI00371327E7
MTSFLTHRAHVHDTYLPFRRRHSALRICITLFAPYGFRATYHHPHAQRRDPPTAGGGPDVLVRAVEELHEARVLWLARAEEYTAQPPRDHAWWADRVSAIRPRPFRRRDRRGCGRHLDLALRSGCRVRYCNGFLRWNRHVPQQHH